MNNKLAWVAVVLFYACNAVLGTKNLGSGYYFDTDQIVYTEKKQYDGVGFSVIPPEVLSIGINRDFILISSKNNLGIIKYWIVVKKGEKKKIKYLSNEEFSGYYIYTNVDGPLNEAEFKEARKNHHVPNDLELKPVD